MKIKIILACLALLAGSLHAETLDAQTYAHQLSSWVIDQLAAGEHPDYAKMYSNVADDLFAQGLNDNQAKAYLLSVMQTVTDDLKLATQVASQTVNKVQTSEDSRTDWFEHHRGDKIQSEQHYTPYTEAYRTAYGQWLQEHGF